MKTEKVTIEQKESIKSIVESHNKNAYDYVKGIKEAAVYLKDNVEKQGLAEYVHVTIDGVRSSQWERDICTDMYDEIAGFSTHFEGKTD